MSDPAFAEWLQSPSRQTTATSAAISDVWGDMATATSALTYFDDEAAAIAEGDAAQVSAIPVQQDK